LEQRDTTAGDGKHRRCADAELEKRAPLHARRVLHQSRRLA
jgi:hypothetical protein